MAEIKIGGTPTYTIPLDGLDLAYLSKYVRTTGADKPLWSKKWLDGESEYCQVQIHTQPYHNDDCYSEPSDSYKCHVCNILVPTPCSQKHNASERHETSMKLYQKVLENLSNQMNISTINKDQDIHKDLYYCEPCSKIIKIKNKEKHEISDHHAKSVKDLSIINDFFKLLILNSCYNVCDANENLLDEETDLESDCYKANYFDDSNDDDGKACRIMFDSDDDSLSHSLRITAGNSIVTKNQPLNDKKKEDFAEYLKEMIEKYNLTVNLPLINGDSISIVAPNGETIKVSREHFHSYRELKNSVYCQLCNMWISQDTRPHDISEHHVRNIFRPINDKFARLVDTISSHCVPCNEVVPTNSNHESLNDNHKTIIKNTMTLKTDIKNNIKLKENKVRICAKPCSGANTASSGSTNQIYDRVASSSSLPSTASSYSNGTDHEDDKINAYYDLLQFTDKNQTKVRCKICSVNIVNVERNIIEHMEGRNHIENANKNKFDSVPSSSSLPSTVSSYSSGTNHEDEKINAYYNLLQFTDKSQTKVRCKICSVNIVYVERNIIEHMEGRNHIENSNQQKIEKYYKLLCYIDDEKSKVHCAICDVNVPFVERNIIEHMEGRNHEIAENELLKFHLVTKESSEFVCECCDIHVIDFFDHINSRTHTLQFQEKYAVDKTEMRKYVYDEDVHNSISRRHRERYRNLLKHNGIYKLDDVNYYCGICHIKLGRISEIYHVLGERHRSNQFE